MDTMDTKVPWPLPDPSGAESILLLADIYIYTAKIDSRIETMYTKTQL